MILVVMVNALLLRAIYLKANNGETVSIMTSIDTTQMTPADRTNWIILKKAISDKSIEKINELLRINMGDMSLNVSVCDAFSGGGEYSVVVVSISNTTQKTLIIFEPKIDQLSTASSHVMLYSIECSLAGSSWCRSLEPGGALLHAFIIDTPKNDCPLQFSLSTPRIIRLSPLEYEGNVVARKEVQMRAPGNY